MPLTRSFTLSVIVGLVVLATFLNPVPGLEYFSTLHDVVAAFQEINSSSFEFFTSMMSFCFLNMPWFNRIPPGIRNVIISIPHKVLYLYTLQGLVFTMMFVWVLPENMVMNMFLDSQTRFFYISVAIIITTIFLGFLIDMMSYKHKDTHTLKNGFALFSVNSFFGSVLIFFGKNTAWFKTKYLQVLAIFMSFVATWFQQYETYCITIAIISVFTYHHVRIERVLCIEFKKETDKTHVWAYIPNTQEGAQDELIGVYSVLVNGFTSEGFWEPEPNDVTSEKIRKLFNTVKIEFYREYYYLSFHGSMKCDSIQIISNSLSGLSAVYTSCNTLLKIESEIVILPFITIIVLFTVIPMSVVSKKDATVYSFWGNSIIHTMMIIFKCLKLVMACVLVKDFEKVIIFFKNNHGNIMKHIRVVIIGLVQPTTNQTSIFDIPTSWEELWHQTERLVEISSSILAFSTSAWTVIAILGSLVYG